MKFSLARLLLLILLAAVGCAALVNANGTWRDLRDDLLTDKAVRWLFAAIQDEVALQPNQRRVLFTPDGQTFATASRDGTAWVWNARSGALIKPKTQTVQFKNFADIGHALWVLIIACVGGAAASFLARKNNDRPMSTATMSQTQL